MLSWTQIGFWGVGDGESWAALGSGEWKEKGGEIEIVTGARIITCSPICETPAKPRRRWDSSHQPSSRHQHHRYIYILPRCILPSHHHHDAGIHCRSPPALHPCLAAHFAVLVWPVGDFSTSGPAGCFQQFFCCHKRAPVLCAAQLQHVYSISGTLNYLHRELSQCR